METTIDSVIIEIESSAEKSDENLKELVNTIKQLRNTVKPTISSLNEFNEGLKKTDSNLSKTNNTTKKSTENFSKLKSSISTVTKGLLAFVGITSLSNFMTEAITQSNEYVENMNLLKVSMGQASDEALKFANSMQEVLGVDSSKVIRYQTTFYNLADGFGVGSENAYIMSKNLTQLSYDMSSFLNIPVEQAMQKIKSGFSGEIEPMRAVGIALDQATLQETAYRLGINKTVSTMTRAQKTQLLYYQIMTKTEKMQGDMARTLLQPANAIRVLKEQVTLFARAVGNVLIPIIMKMIPYLMVLTKWLTAAAQTIANFLGFELDINGWGDATSNISAGIEDIGDSAEGTTKKLKEMLAPFDELNVIDFGDNAGGAGGISTDTGLFDIPLYDYDALSGALTRNIDEIEQKMKSIWSWAGLIAGVILGWKVSSALEEIFKLGLTKELGLTLLIANIVWAAQIGQQLRDGEVTDLTALQAIAAAIGAGVGGGMLLASATAGLTISLVVGEWLLASYGEGQAPDWVKFLLGSTGDFFEGAFLRKLGMSRQYTTSIGMTVYAIIGLDAIFKNNFPELRKTLYDSLFKVIKGVIYDIAEKIKKIPIIGYGIGSAIQAGIRAMEGDTAETVEETTTKALDRAKPSIKETANGLGVDTSESLVFGFKERFDSERTNITSNIKNNLTIATNDSKSTAKENGTLLTNSYIEGETTTFERSIPTTTRSLQNTITTSTRNSESTAVQAGTKIANQETNSLGNTISNFEGNLRNRITNLVRSANNNVDTSSSYTVGSNMASNIKYGFEGWNLEYYLGRDAANIGETIGDEISDNMVVDNYTLGRTLNSALSSTLSTIKNNNWNIFGSGGILSNLLNFKWSFFESGGFPTEGEAFIARENGPELVGKIGNKTAVANNDQIITGIAQGVMEGVSQAMGGSQQKQPINVYVGNKKVYSGYGEYANTENNMYGVNVVRV